MMGGDRASPRHPAYDAMLQKLRATKSQLFALHEAHEMTVKHQASDRLSSLEHVPLCAVSVAGDIPLLVF